MTYINRNDIEKKIQRLIDDRSVSKKLCCLYGIEKIGKTFTLEHIRNKMLKNSLVMFLPLNYNNVSNPIFLKNSILQLLCDTGIAFEKNFNAKELMFEMFKGINLKFGAVRYDARSFIDNVENALSDYETAIRTSIKRDELYIEKLADIVSYVSKRCGRMLYVLIDNAHNADMQIWAFLNVISIKIPDLGFFLTYDRNFSYDTNKKIDALVNNFINLSKSNHELREFEITETKNYLEKRGIYSDIDHLAEIVQTYTAGIPGYVSILTNDLDALGKIKDNRDFMSLMAQVYDNLTEDEKIVVKYIHLNGGELPLEILEAIAREYADVNVEKAIDSLVHKKGIIKENEDSYELKLKLILGNITKFARKSMHSKLYNMYKNSSLKSTSEHIYHANIIMLSKAVGDFSAFFDSVIQGSAFFNEHFKYEIAAGFLADALSINERKPTIEQKINIIIQYVEALFFLKDMKRIIDVYEALSVDESSYIDSSYSFLRLKIGNAYYYNNMHSKVYSVVASVKETNEMDALKKASILCATYDLEGNYEKSKEQYRSFVNNKKRDVHSVYVMDTFIQMIENDHYKCIEKLDDAIKYFENYPRKTIPDFRCLAAAYNNMGIEILMNSKDSEALEYLNKSRELFEKYFPIEIHFPLNNIGLYHLLASKNIDDALYSFTIAFQRAISPLQKGYVSQNTASAYFLAQNYEDAKKHIENAEKFIDFCPDPVAKNYLSYNLSFINKKMGNSYERVQYLKKPQLELLNKKRQNLNKEPCCEESGVTNRRRLFASCEIEPCELMFYEIGYS